jgi:hypothetical protein
MRHDLDFFEQFGAIFRDTWRDVAACADTEDDIFFNPDREEQAERICGQCPVWADCVDDAVYYDDGGYRGMDEKSRSSIIMHRKRNIKSLQHDLGLLDE